MKFIIWTICWFMLRRLGQWLEYHYGGGVEGNQKRYGENVEALAELVHFILWITLYLIFVE